MTFTRGRDLLAAGLGSAALVFLLLKLSYSQLPPLPRLAGVVLLVIAAVDLGLAVSLRARILRKPGAEPVQALTAARAVALAKASSALGAIMAGAWGAVLLHVAPARGRFPAADNDLTSAVVGLVCAAALIASGLWLERCCRTPDQPEHRA
ncbi:MULTISPECIES: DUF3180 domain-containing protein [Actinosynnema]|uniref:DUF3180 domain-containing protein n=1 Tax=Actinosynnema TaxID=40566 RepID=UPI0020A2D257|nr:DUF3180 domain-containing protein [Actinosynnema pretiosum]MCP2096900.1 Protein of unknown function (DUF3180) [Actinosynnema pretiosum]